MCVRSRAHFSSRSLSLSICQFGPSIYSFFLSIYLSIHLSTHLSSARLLSLFLSVSLSSSISFSLSLSRPKCTFVCFMMKNYCKVKHLVFSDSVVYLFNLSARSILCYPCARCHSINRSISFYLSPLFKCAPQLVVLAVCECNPRNYYCFNVWLKNHQIVAR